MEACPNSALFLPGGGSSGSSGCDAERRARVGLELCASPAGVDAVPGAHERLPRSRLTTHVDMFSRDATSQENPCAPPSQCCATCLFVSGVRACEIGACFLFRVFCVSAARCFDAVPLVLLVRRSSFVLSLSCQTPVRLRVWREVGLRERTPCSETDQPPSKHAWNASWPQPCRMRAKRGPEDLSVVGCDQVQRGCLALRGVRAHRGRRVPDAADEGEGLRAPAGLLPRSSPSQPPPKGRLLRTVTFWAVDKRKRGQRSE